MQARDVAEVLRTLESMPADYRASFDLEAARAHEQIVRRRGDRPVHVELWRELRERVVAICVVADDRPGLLSCISAALVADRIDVVGAHAYCRSREDGSVEAVDFLWVRRLPAPRGLVSPIRTRDLDAIAQAIERAVVEGAPPVPSSAHVRGSERPRVPDGATARVRFETNEKDGSTSLTVEALDRPGLLLAVTQALFRAGVHIVGLSATTERGRAVDRFTLAESDGTQLRRDRLLAPQTAILEAVDEGTLAPLRRSAG
jgi:[protein-PII] uridylyltransferase